MSDGHHTWRGIRTSGDDETELYFVRWIPGTRIHIRIYLTGERSMEVEEIR